MAAMIKKDLIDRIHRRMRHLHEKDVSLSVRLLLEVMTHALANNERIEIRGFGVFKLNYRPPRLSRNPKTHVPVQVPEKMVPHFKMGKTMREAIERQVSLTPIRSDTQTPE